MFLVDTSVWVEVFRKPSRIRLDEEIPLDQIATCLPIVQEVLRPRFYAFGGGLSSAGT
jgi:predicted nucleic acid-binding protein